MWRKTRNHRDWRETRVTSRHFIAEEVRPGHPFAGHLSVGDMRLHLSNTISNTESGKRVSAAVANTSKAVAGSLTSAKGAFSSFLGSFKTASGTVEPAETAAEATEVRESAETKD